jgi:CRISPR-associated DxTHG motif protein
MKLIAFLGTGEYKCATYRWNDHTYETSFVQEAFVHWLKPEATCVLLTEKARARHWNDLSQRLQGHTQIVEVDIPDGKSEAELWRIFEKISDAVCEGDQIAFDITHSFRSLPVIALLTIAYLKQVKGVKVQYVLYGAYEALDNQGAPVFDLTPFADLLDWLAAAKMFMATGDSSELGQLIQEVQNDAYRNRGAYAENLPRALKNFGMALEEVSNDLLLARVPNLPDSIRKLAQRQSEGRHRGGSVDAAADPASGQDCRCLRAVPRRQSAHASQAYPLVSESQPHRASDDSGARVGGELLCSTKEPFPRRRRR